MNERLLHTAHYHVVFSGPAALTAAWRREPHDVIDSLFAAVRKTMRTESKRCGLRFGMVAQFHSHGEGLCYKPHLHCLITAGGMDGAGRWQSDHRLSESVLRVDFVRRILEETGRRLSPRVACEVHNGKGEWGVYVTLHRHSPGALVGYFARSLHGVVCGSEEGLTVAEEEITIDGRNGSRRGERVLSRAEFLRRYLAHIPPWKAVTVRHYGLYATRSAAVLESARAQIAAGGDGTGSDEGEWEGEELCPECTTPMLVAYAFYPYEVPALLTRIKRARGSPIKHGECIRIEEITA